MPSSGFPSVVTGVTVQTQGAISGDGSSGDKLAVGVDGTTIDVNSSNQLEVISGSEAPVDASYLTVDDETAVLTGSRRLLAGDNISFDDTTPGERTVSAASVAPAGNNFDLQFNNDTATPGEFGANDLLSWNNDTTTLILGATANLEIDSLAAPMGETYTLKIDDAGAVSSAAGGGGTPSGDPGSIQFNDSGSFGGFGSWDGTGIALGAGAFLALGDDPSSTGSVRLPDSVDGGGDTTGIWGTESDNYGNDIALLRLTLNGDDYPQATIGDDDFGRIDFNLYGTGSSDGAIVPSAPFPLGTTANRFGAGFFGGLIASTLTLRQVAETPKGVLSIYDNSSGKEVLLDLVGDPGLGQIRFGSDPSVTLHATIGTSIGGYSTLTFPGPITFATQTPAFDFSYWELVNHANVVPGGSGEGHAAGFSVETYGDGIDSTHPALFVQDEIEQPAAPTIANIGTPGSSTVTYKIVGKMDTGNHTEAGVARTTTTANATLNGTNFNRLTITWPAGANAIDIYRTAGGPSQGKIASDITTGAAFDDTGLAGDSSVPPTTNTTGHVYVGTALDVLASGVFGGTVTASDFIVSGSRFKSDTTNAHTGGLAVYDVDGASYVDFMTWTNGNTPTAALFAPTGGTLSIAPTLFTLASTVVGSLGTCDAGATGQVKFVTDALLPVSLATVGAGGAVKVPVFCNGSAWTVF